MTQNDHLLLLFCIYCLTDTAWSPLDCPLSCLLLKAPESLPQAAPPDPCLPRASPSSLGAPGDDSESEELPGGPLPAEALPAASFSHFFLFLGGGSAFTLAGRALGSREVAAGCPVARLRSGRICRPPVPRSPRSGRSPRVTRSFSFSFSTVCGGDDFSRTGGSAVTVSGIGSGGFSDVLSGVSGLGGGAGVLGGGAELPPVDTGPLACPERLKKNI